MRRFVALSIGISLTGALAPSPATGQVNRWRPSGPDVPVNFIAADPGPARTLYATSIEGLFSSSDYGSSWQLITDFEVDVLAVDLGNPSVLYGSSSLPQRGVFKSTDGGRTWTPASNGLRSFAWLILHAAGPNHIYGVDDRGVYETMDQAATWRQVTQDLFNISAFTVDPTNPRRLYASTYSTGQFGDVFRSDDGGASWNRGSGMLGQIKTNIAVDSADPRRVYVGADCCNDFWKSTDYGASWTRLPAPANQVSSVLVDSTGRVLLGTGPGPCPSAGPCPPQGTGVFRSSDEGVTWQPLNEGLGYRSIRHLLLVADGRRLIAVTNADPGTFLYDFGVVADVPDLTGRNKAIFALLLGLAGLVAIRGSLANQV